ncbi:SLC13 family permease [uncultured Clostridium sp.]|uniref:SLC13 family permease n=1 Tax=uncultured Clostridium sp. TaxID=59620 RepID=UPI0025CD1C49|nr:SLC13 family permease [uncultured Clostridium sp.]
MNQKITSLKQFLKNETVFCIAAMLALLSSLVIRPGKEYVGYIDFRTLALLFCLMAVVAGMQSIGVFTLLGQKLLSGTHGTKKLSFILVFLCFFCSMAITNDVSLITFVPFTILVYQMVGKEERLIKLIVLETIAANLGSMATPVGNPQNLYLYSVSAISMADFMEAVLPYAAVSMLLLGFVLAAEKDEKIEVKVRMGTGPEDAGAFVKRFAVYLLLFLFSLLVVIHIVPWQLAFLAVLFWMLARDRKVLKELDYFLLLTFVCFFIFIGNMKRIDAVNLWLSSLIDGRELITGIAASQIISNVPAAILLSGFTGEYKTLLTAVNLGGLGTLIASLASLISYKFFVRAYGEKKGVYFKIFTGWNLAFFAVLAALAVLLTGGL